MGAPATTERRRYSDQEAVEALQVVVECNGNVLAAAQETGIPRGTLQRWNNGERRSQLRQVAQDQREDRAAAYDRVVDRALGKLTDEKLEKAGAYELMKVAAIATDKALLLRGEPTEITAQARDPEAMSDEEIKAELARMRDERGAGATGAGIPVGGGAEAT